MADLTNREQGKIFEELFLKQAQRLGITCLRNYQTCRFLFKGRVQVIPGQLDFTLITQDGKVGFFDCKTFDSNHFTFSQLTEHQVIRSVLYNDNQVPSGFVVWFRPINSIVYFTGLTIAFKGSGSRFNSSDGIYLGRFEQFNLNIIMNKP